MKFRESIKNVLPYVPGKSIEEIKKEYNIERVVKLASNENPYGVSPAILEHIKDISINRYPDNYVKDLRLKLSNMLDIDKDMLLFGNGSVEIIEMLSRILLNEGDNIICENPSFSSYFSEAMIQGANIKTVEYNKDYSFNILEMLNLIDDRTKMIYITNPNNPLGSAISYSTLLSFISKVPKEILVVVDEAYMEYVRDENIKSCINLIGKYSNVCVLRTFSKAYGLASLRIGYIVASKQVITNLEKVRVPFNVSTVAKNSALIALENIDYMKDTVRKTHDTIDYMYKELDKLNIEYIKTNSNFIFLNLNIDSKITCEELLKRGVIVRGGFHPLDTWIRVSIGTREEMDFFLAKLKEVLNK